jgi:hypothetical protein
MTAPADPWSPWENADPDALTDALECETFDAQVKALLDLSPKASAAQVLALPVWPEKHTKREVTLIRDAWAFQRGSKREVERERDELPLDQAVMKQFQASARSGDWKGAKDAFELMTKIQASKIRDTDAPEDDFSRLTDTEVLFLGALLHKLRDEPMTEFDEQAIAYVGAIGAGGAT